MTRLLNEADLGSRQAAGALLPLVYEQLRELARQRMASERAGHTLQPTALVHEAYVRLVGGGDGLRWGGRAHFFHAAAEAMRRILIDRGRERRQLKRGGGRRQVPLDAADFADSADFEEILALDDAVSRLEKECPAVAAVVRLRFYAGLTVSETAEALGLSARTVNREWTYARAWLFRELGYGRE